MKTFIVLGMHRSATSLAAKGLHESGVYMGEDLLGKNSSNPYGHFENRRFVQLNDALLDRAGGKWDKPPEHARIIKAGQELSSRIEQTVAMESKGHEFWGWKDPRTTLTIQCYWQYLTNPHLIICFRLKWRYRLKKETVFHWRRALAWQPSTINEYLNF